MLHKNVIEAKCGFRTLDAAELEAVSGGSWLGNPTIDGQTIGDNGEKLPTTWAETSWGEAACIVAVTALGIGEIATDVACGTDLSGNNPNQAGLTEAERLEREKAYLEEGLDGLMDAMPEF